MTSTEILAHRLNGAYHGPLISPIAAELEEGSIAAAYAVQLEQVRMWQAAGRRVVGRKIGLTSPAVQRQLGVDSPDFGHLMADMVFGDATELDYTRLQQPKAEAEIALILEKPIPHPDATVADVIAATGWVLPALEIVSSRIADWRISILDTVADNASSGLVALGGPARRLDGLDLVGCTMTMWKGEEVVSQGRGADCLGSPLNAAAWLARAACANGTPLEAGEVILTGALGPMVPVAPGDVVRAEISGIGAVETRFSVPDKEISA
ncbi:fumarylacetoacetate hydrolase family protein [Novosphingobium profundi]|uniref:2-keto-4-pentenoate hydratase n=1 Tax=Novosphingobium profundi TaxID=1774954 RepID=UPI001BDADB0F|nr:fumarylacetoacetate hydrolase family protein [Novosphingobium profundi]MBT0670677.1 fumarylacetoacetate hydrolase family protein [Novosphingobium profundi]